MPFTLLALVSHNSTATEYLQLNCACVPLIVTRPMMGTIPFFSLLLFTKNSTLNVALILSAFFGCKISFTCAKWLKANLCRTAQNQYWVVKNAGLSGLRFGNLTISAIRVILPFLPILQSYEKYRINHYLLNSCPPLASCGFYRGFFYLKRNAPKKNGMIPVMCRITVNGKVSQFSSKLDVEEKMWNVELGKLTGRSLVAQEGNRMLDKIRLGINKAYQEVCDTDGYVTAEKVRNAYLGLGQNHKTLLAVFKQHNEDYAKQVGKMKSERSYWKYCVVYNHLSEFIKQRYKVSDIALRELTPAFITDFELFLRTEKNHCTNTVWSYMMPFRSIIFTAINNGWLARDPFYAYHITKEETKRGFLTKEEITALINGTFKKKSYELIRDLFIFCCFTGLSWRDMYNLTEENLQTSFDGHLWIKTNRQKTGVESNIRLLDVPKHIIEKYSGMTEDGRLLPVPLLSPLPIRHQSSRQAMRHQQERHLAPEPPLVCHHHLPLQRCAD